MSDRARRRHPIQAPPLFVVLSASVTIGEVDLPGSDGTTTISARLVTVEGYTEGLQRRRIRLVFTEQLGGQVADLLAAEAPEQPADEPL